MTAVLAAFMVHGCIIPEMHMAELVRRSLRMDVGMSVLSLRMRTKKFQFTPPDFGTGELFNQSRQKTIWKWFGRSRDGLKNVADSMPASEAARTVCLPEFGF